MKKIKELPQHLKEYIYPQEEVVYTAEDQAVWRFLLRQLSNYLRDKAYPCYIDGLNGSGIKIDSIPVIKELDKNIRNFGWSVVPVSGFIPPAAFMEFQSLGYLPVATAMRRIENILYTPAPDIVHETAGHAPILIDKEYALYLRNYSEVASKAIISSEDLSQYKLIRKISDLKELEGPSSSKVEKLEVELALLSSQMKISEAVYLGRMNWWTSEYGLVGDLKNPKIIGAGLLSSFGEAQQAFSDKVKKVPLSVDCINSSYDITNHQPQLFVARDFKHMSEVLYELENILSYKRGGIYGLNKAIEAQTVNTVAFENGLQISGALDSYENSGEDVTFIKFSGPTQICLNGQELTGHGKTYHSHGYSSPLGKIKELGSLPQDSHWDKWKNQIDFTKGKTIALTFKSGLTLSGEFKNVVLDGENKPLIIGFTKCSVTYGDRVYFDPSWGDFDLVVASKVISVFGGPADKPAFGELEEGFKPPVVQPNTDKNSNLNLFYKEVRDLRNTSANNAGQFNELSKHFFDGYKDKWLLNLELYEVAKNNNYNSHDLLDNLLKIKDQTPDPDIKTCIEKGLELC